MLAAGFGFLMTLFGVGSYWATIQLYPLYRVNIERAAWFVAVCTAAALTALVAVGRLQAHRGHNAKRPLQWDWFRLRAVTYVVFMIAVVGTVITIRRIGYVPILTGDPTSARADFREIAGAWYRVSMLGGVVTLLVSAQAAARQATPVLYAIGVASLGLVGLYGPRFFVALPVGVALLLWDRVRAPLKLSRAVTLIAFAAPLLAFAGYWRDRNQSVLLLGPLGLSLYGTLGEFRDLGWALDYYGFGDRFLNGRTLGSVIVPILPTQAWSALGIDKAAIYSQNSASLLADAMGQPTAQRIGAYGELFMNFGWSGAILGAVLYGLALAYLDDRLRRVQSGDVRGVFLALALATALFAQIGQLNMFTSTLTDLGYPLALVALVAGHRSSARLVATR